MTICFETTVENTHYSVRRAGGSIRLYSNGVFHTQWNPNRPLSGGIWDCLSLPVLYLPASPAPRILLLGGGGGAVVRQLYWLIEYCQLQVVERDPVHIDIARRWFGVTDSMAELHLADAVTWLETNTAGCFDMVVDDLFGHAEGVPVRSRAVDARWAALLRRAVSDTGLLVLNSVSGRELKRTLPVLQQAGFIAGYRWSQPNYDNAVAVCFPSPVNSRLWNRRLSERRLPAAAERMAKRPFRRPLRMGV